MYCPFLRARQFELIALRELANEEITQGVIIPILEPVKETHNNLNLAHQVFRDKRQVAYLIVNPSVGDNNHYLEYLRSLEAEGDIFFKPASHYRNNKQYISESIDKYNLNDCMLICQNDLSADDLNFRELVNSPEISTINVEDPGRNRSFHRRHSVIPAKLE